MFSSLDGKTDSALSLSYKIQARWDLTSFENELSKFVNFELEVVHDWYQGKKRHFLEKAARL